MSFPEEVVEKILGHSEENEKEDVTEKIFHRGRYGRGRGFRTGPKDGRGPNMNCGLKK